MKRRTGMLTALFYVGPAVLFLLVYQVYPALQTVYLSFLDRRSESFVGLENYKYVFTSQTMLRAFKNNLLWLVLFTAGTVGLGLLFAILVDRVKYERIAKSIIFMPMAISFVGAGVVWKFIYAYKPSGAEQIGLLNQIMVVLGFEPKGWLLESPINNLALIVVGLWIWTGYCMVILSAAYKGIPKELMEAGQVDGANDWQVFRHIIIPEMRPALTMVTTTMLVNVLKIFDIIYVMTNGNYGTEVIANRMFKEMFQFANTGRASAIAVVLFVMIIPIMYANIRQKLKGEG
ncbi:carbohydrate ABC transporter permease [Candidatus Darwinibacter acetoxidans]|nr:sugar ABC transporter permease [Limnochordia bacterium]MDI9465532.1 sugar ABC transporter permease [Bacillota bacterium]NLO96182.1 sugar ABC transporter permease [Bacillota bacterium]HAI52722.1 ABC transporter [Bacillota bacterium]HAN94144.1 ABC transporter [Bacillota bacterium]